MEGRERRHKRIRKKIIGTKERPRIVVYRSLKHIYAQIVDDIEHITLVGVSSQKFKGNTKKERSYKCGEELAKLAIEKGIKKVVFDRSGYKYHGRVKMLAEGARKGGLEF
jgi:large subunit ribosomal protein L18